jgi:hypothetical protein
MWIVGHGHGLVAASASVAGTALVIDTAGATSADPPIRQLVHLVSVAEITDPLLENQITQIGWTAADALAADHDLTVTELAGNVVPAVQGRRNSETFAIPPGPAGPSGDSVRLALVRMGRNRRPGSPLPDYRLTLAGNLLAWLPTEGLDGDTAQPARPEVVLAQQPVPPATNVVWWRWRRRLLGAEGQETAFTITPERYSAIDRLPDGTFVVDYDGGDGATLRFGDGTFGTLPQRGSVFQVTYRIGGGTRGNVAPDTVTALSPAASALVRAATNPFPAAGGGDAETAQQVRDRAPEQFRARPLRIVKPIDYEQAARGLPWVQAAGTTFHWTGSWLTVFTAADPRASEEVTVDEHTQLFDLLSRRRLAGYESYVLAPHYVSLDLIVTVCAQPDRFKGDVEAAVALRLSAGRLPDGTTGFFHPDRRSFGTPLERSALEAAVQDAAGVDGVVSVRYRWRGALSGFADLPDRLDVAANDILRVDNDPSQPEHGSIRVIVEGGK